jgi:hypothetical protein
MVQGAREYAKGLEPRTADEHARITNIVQYLLATVLADSDLRVEVQQFPEKRELC